MEERDAFCGNAFNQNFKHDFFCTENGSLPRLSTKKTGHFHANAPTPKYAVSLNSKLKHLIKEKANCSPSDFQHAQMNN